MRHYVVVIARVESVLAAQGRPNLLRVGPVEVGQRTGPSGGQELDGHSQTAKTVQSSPKETY